LALIRIIYSFPNAQKFGSDSILQEGQLCINILQIQQNGTTARQRFVKVD
jgi:hypothetical protein